MPKGLNSFHIDAKKQFNVNLINKAIPKSKSQSQTKNKNIKLFVFAEPKNK